MVRKKIRRPCVPVTKQCKETAKKEELKTHCNAKHSQTTPRNAKGKEMKKERILFAEIKKFISKKSNEIQS